MIYFSCMSNGADYIATRGRFSEAEARVKFLDVLSAVDYAHSCGIVHRDLKAENLLFDANMNIKLIDFSFGTHHPDSKRPQSLLSTWCGSPPYAAPEIFKGEPYVGTKADIWSLGVVLYVMVCGTLPFDAQALPHLRHQVLSASFRVPYWLSCVCERLIRWMLSKVPSKRPTTQEIFHHAWFTQPLPELSRDRSILPVETALRDSGVNCPIWSHESSLSPMSSSDCGESNLNSSRTSLVDPLSNLAADVELGRVNEFVILIMESYGMKRSQIFESLSRRAYDHLMATYLLLGEKIRQKRFSLNLTNLTPNSLNELVADNCPADSETIPSRPWTVKHSRVDSAVDVKSSISEYEAPRIPGDFSASLTDSEVGIVPSAFLHSSNTTFPAHHIRSWLPQSSDIPMEQVHQLPSCSEQLGVTDPMQLTMTWTTQQPLPSNRYLAIPSLDNPTQVLDETQLVASIPQHRLVDFGEADQTTHPWLISAQNDLEDTEPSRPHTPPPLRRTLVRRKYGVFNPPAHLDQLAKAVMEQQRQAPSATHTDPDDDDSTHQTTNET
ncbi:hypothetical protein EG68_07884 [Paragonimus skrjabini miyazakii]|uniref:Protein kinase domain-containing protein n=1 Tax=Paragonimus skrjabini miyazakii TaxID=59628 RepID=A0A8S9YXX5_9TREM|nr:hypothetical protein EG68_07884 [Paragonimus skrjabini miyazakii]